MDSLTILESYLEYNFSANAEMLQRVKKLSAEQLVAVARISNGTAFDLVRHMLDTDWSWRQFASGGTGQQFLWEVEEIPDLATVERVWHAERLAMLDFLRSLSVADLEQLVDYGTAQGGQPQH